MFPTRLGHDTIIAPFWADIDTTGTGTVYYRETSDPSLLSRAANEIQGTIATSFMPSHLFIATWDAVGYYMNRTDKVINIYECTLHYVSVSCSCELRAHKVMPLLGNSKF